MMTSTDKGVTWSAIRTISSAPDKPWAGGGITEGTVFVSWLGNPGGIKRSLDHGVTWGPTQSLGNIIHGTAITVATTGLVHVPYNLDSNRNQLRYLRSKNNGDTWEATRDLVPDMGTFCFSCNPRQHPIVGAARRSRPARSSPSPGPAACPAARRTTTSGCCTRATAATPGRNRFASTTTPTASRQFESWVAVDNYGRVHVAWTDFRNGGQNETWYARSADPTKGFEPNMQVTDGRGSGNTDFLGDYKGIAVSGPGRAGGLAGHAPRQRRHLLLAGGRCRGPIGRRRCGLRSASWHSPRSRRQRRVAGRPQRLRLRRRRRRRLPSKRRAPRRAKSAPRLPEDPVLGKQSEQQWREHLRHEEEERQMWFDQPRLEQHRAVAKLFAASRARYDRARTEAAVAKVRAEMPRRLAEVRSRVTKIDPWGNNSRLLPDYDALSTLLSGAYPDACVAAIKGDHAALEQARAGFDQRMQHVEHWLAEVAAESDEGEAHEADEHEAEAQEAEERGEK